MGRAHAFHGFMAKHIELPAVEGFIDAGFMLLCTSRTVYLHLIPLLRHVRSLLESIEYWGLWRASVVMRAMSTEKQPFISRRYDTQQGRLTIMGFFLLARMLSSLA